MAITPLLVTAAAPATTRPQPMAYPNTAAGAGRRAVGTADNFAADTRSAARRRHRLWRQPHRRRARRRPDRQDRTVHNRRRSSRHRVDDEPDEQPADTGLACRGHRADPDRHHAGDPGSGRGPSPQGRRAAARRHGRPDHGHRSGPDPRRRSAGTETPSTRVMAGRGAAAAAGGARAGADRRGLAVEHLEEQPAEHDLGAGPRLARHRRPQRPVRRRELPDRRRRQPARRERRHGCGRHRGRRGRPLGHRDAGQHPRQPQTRCGRVVSARPGDHADDV